MEEDKQSIRLNVFLMKERVTEPKHALIPTHDDYKPLTGPEQDGFSTELLYFGPKENVPTWREFLAQGIDDLPGIANKSHSAILFVRNSDGYFAIPFGQGQSRLNPAQVESSFGRRIVVNTIKPDGIISMSRRGFGTVSIIKEEEATQGIRQEIFGANSEAEMLNGIIGIPDPSHNLASRLQGRDNLIVSRSMKFDELGKFCSDLKGHYERDDYRKNGFAWIDHLKEITTPDEIAALDDRFIEVLKLEDETVQLSAPDGHRTSEIAGFKYIHSHKKNDVGIGELDIKEWYQIHRYGLPTLDAARLRKSWHVEAWPAEGSEYISRRPMMDAFIHDVVDGSDRYVLSTGKWYKVERELNDNLNDEIARMTTTTSKLLATTSGQLEDSYIKGHKHESGLTIMHGPGNFVRIGGSHIEPCDIFDHDGRFVHIKRWTSSATFSHMLQQGLVSAISLQQHPSFHKDMYKKLVHKKRTADKYFKEHRHAPFTFTVTYALMYANPRGLPFFSRLSLVNTSKRLNSMGYNVEFYRVP